MSNSPLEALGVTKIAEGTLEKEGISERKLEGLGGWDTCGDVFRGVSFVSLNGSLASEGWDDGSGEKSLFCSPSSALSSNVPSLSLCL